VRIRLKDAPFNTLLVMREGMDEELRETYYVRRTGEGRPPNFVPTYRLACLQGERWRGT
jgi:hypothetical protein